MIITISSNLTIPTPQIKKLIKIKSLDIKVITQQLISWFFSPMNSNSCNEFQKARKFEK
jgi:hypothetical protein